MDSEYAGGRKKNAMASEERKVASSPGPGPPYKEPTITASTNSRKTLRSITGSNSSVRSSATALSKKARP
jgi:hypothetical protein